MATNTKNKPLTAAQQKHLRATVTALIVAKAAHDKAQAVAEATRQARDTAQTQANNFVAYCAEEMGVPLGNGWTFNEAMMAFEQMPQEGKGETE